MTRSLLVRKITPVLRRHRVKRSSLFGSYARGEQKKGSDVDILIEPPKGMTLFGLAGLKLELEKKLGMKVDVLTYDGVSPRLKNYIEQEAVRIYG